MTNSNILKAIDVNSKKCIYSKNLTIDCNRINTIKPIGPEKLLLQLEDTDHVCSWYLFDSNLAELVSLNSFYTEIDNIIEESYPASIYNHLLRDAYFVNMLESNISEYDDILIEKLADFYSKIEIIEDKIYFYEDLNKIDELCSLYFKIFSFFNKNEFKARLIDFLYIKRKSTRGNKEQYSNLISSLINKIELNENDIRILEINV